MSVIILSGLGSEFVPTDTYKGVIGLGPNDAPYEVVPQPNDDLRFIPREVVKVLDSGKAVAGKASGAVSGLSTPTKVALGAGALALIYVAWKKWKK